MTVKSTSKVLVPSISVYLLSKVLVTGAKFSQICIRLVAQFRFYPRNRIWPTLLVVESGVDGWDLIEYQEMYASAAEYLGDAKVLKLSVSKQGKYLKEVSEFIRANDVTHYVYDPRTGSQNFYKGLFEAYRIACLFAWQKITPIARLSDLPERRWRLQCAVVTSNSGVCTTLMLPAQMRLVFPHSRLIGPMIMAMSKETIIGLRKLREIRQENSTPRVIFTGAMYEPRATFLFLLKEILEIRGIDLILEVRSIGEKRDSNNSYWQRLLNADIVITTADLFVGLHGETIDVPHLIYRYSEVLASGALLIAPSVPGSEKYLQKGVDYVPYSTLDEAADAIEFYFHSVEARREIAMSGSARLAHLVEAESFWREIDFSLGADGFI